MSVSEVNSWGPKDQAVSREAEAGGGGRAGFQWVHVLTLVWTAGSPRSSLTPNTQNGPPPSCRVAKEPAAGAWAVSPGGTVYCSGGGKCPTGKGTQLHGRQSRGWERAGDKKFEPKLSRAGAEGGGACACPTRDAPRSWVALSLSALQEGPAAALPGHAQTRACPVDFRHAHSGAPAPQPHMTDLGLSGGWAPAASPLASCLPWPWQPFWSLAPTAEAAGSQTPGTCGHPGSPRCWQLTPGTLLSKGTSVSQATLGCLSCTTSRPLCSWSCAQSISVTGKACCWVSSLTLTTKSTSDVSSRQPSCSWPEPLTRTTSRAMCTSGLPRDWSIFLCQRRKVRPQPAWERCSPLRAHGLKQSEGPHQSHHVILKCVTHFNSDSGHSNPAPPEDKDTPWFGESSSPSPPVRNVTPNEDTDNLRPIMGPGTSANGHPALSGTWGQVFCCQPRAVDQQPPLKTAAPRGLPWKGGPLAWEEARPC